MKQSETFDKRVEAVAASPQVCCVCVCVCVRFSFSVYTRVAHTHTHTHTHTQTGTRSESGAGASPQRVHAHIGDSIVELSGTDLRKLGSLQLLPVRQNTHTSLPLPVTHTPCRSRCARTLPHAPTNKKPTHTQLHIHTHFHIHTHVYVYMYGDVWR